MRQLPSWEEAICNIQVATVTSFQKSKISSKLFADSHSLRSLLTKEVSTPPAGLAVDSLSGSFSSELTEDVSWMK